MTSSSGSVLIFFFGPLQISKLTDTDWNKLEIKHNITDDNFSAFVQKLALVQTSYRGGTDYLIRFWRLSLMGTV